MRGISLGIKLFSPQQSLLRHRVGYSSAQRPLGLLGKCGYRRSAILLKNHKTDGEKPEDEKHDKDDNIEQADETNKINERSPASLDRTIHAAASAVDSPDAGESFDNDDDPNLQSPGILVPARVPAHWPHLISVPVSQRPVFPGFYKTIMLKDAKVARALIKALKDGQPYVGLFLQRNESETKEEKDKNSDVIEKLEQVHEVGVFAQVINVVPSSGLSDPEAFDDTQSYTAIVYPHRRIRAIRILPDRSTGITTLLTENVEEPLYEKRSPTIRAMMQEIFATLAEVAKLNGFFREHLAHHRVPASVFEDPRRLADFVAVLSSPGEAPLELQQLLEINDVEQRLRLALGLLKKELVAARLQQAISRDVEQKLTQRQREYFLHEQLKSIKKELGLESDPKEKLMSLYKERVEKLMMPAQVKTIFEEELSRLSVLEPAGAEYSVTRNYLDWLSSIPWGINTCDSYDIDKAKEVLDKDHYGLKEVKERILEFIAVAKLKGKPHGKILCLVGPPGVGKTSIGKSIAKALGRHYYRMSVGGLGDVAELKGHRRTYVGALPGKPVQALKRCGSENPLILIDEIDKLGARLGSFQGGDPSAALLELLDPEQNSAFLDHYLDVPVDMSRVLFVCTANGTDTIPTPLLDRMEVVNLAGYVASEKHAIATRYLIPSAIEACGTDGNVILKEEAVRELIKAYCRESGVRNLKKHIEKIFRKAAFKLVRNSDAGKDVSPLPVNIEAEDLKKYVGAPIFTSERMYEGEHLPVGVVTGLAWTSMGGSVLYIETIVERILATPSTTSALIRTGQLGKVMEESSSLAYSYAKSWLSSHHPTNDFFGRTSVHLHVPEGATPKDGPSAGTTMAVALLSLARGVKVRGDLAMTGELSLTGKVLKVGGIKEKCIAAGRSGIKTVILPKANEGDWLELEDEVREGLSVTFVEHFEEIAKLIGL